MKRPSLGRLSSVPLGGQGTTWQVIKCTRPAECPSRNVMFAEPTSKHQSLNSHEANHTGSAARADKAAREV
jgi:hypothetical protein